MTARRALALALFVACTTPAPAQTLAREWTIPPNDEIREILARRMARNGVGIVVGILEPEGRRIVAYGRSGARDGRPLDGDTVFQIGSVTKVFTGLLLADMAVRGEVDVNDPAAKYLPPGITMPERGRAITLIDLSKHWSALPSMPDFSLRADPNPYEAYSAADLYAFLSSYELSREPGKQEYSNLGVALLGRLLARHANTEYETLLRQRVLVPLELESTSITLTSEQKERLAPGHDRFLQPVDTWNLAAMPASGALRSTANDLLRFLSYSVGQRDSPLRAAMLFQRTPKRALGWGASTLGGDTIYGHEGGKEGYRSAVVFNPRTKTGVVVLTNARTDDSPMALARHLLFGGSPLPPATVAPVRPAIARPDASLLDTYAGRYLLESNVLVRIARKGNHLLVSPEGGGVSTFFPSTESEFFSNTDDEQIAFSANGLILCIDGKAERGAKVGSVP